MIHIGIDTGVNTGFAYNFDGMLREVKCLPIHKALEQVKSVFFWSENNGVDIMLHIEDARKRKWYGDNAEAKKQGAGSVKRDSKIWQDFCEDYEIPYMLIHPRSNPKKNAKEFKAITGWTGRTNQHMRDAGMMVWGLK